LDGIRRRYLATHLMQLWRAANFNWQVDGYYTTIDNRVERTSAGLWSLDPQTWSAPPAERRLLRRRRRKNA
jgi:beta-glucosidase